MKKIVLLAGILLGFCGIQAQEVTRGQLMDLHYKARKANNTQEALEIYKTILSIDANNLPIPYLKMADIYATNESDEESIAIAIALYNKYLSLQPNDEDAPAIKNKVTHLRKFVANEQSINLANILYINREQAQNVIATKARRGIRPANKEELEQQMEKVSALYDRTHEAIENNNIAEVTQYAEQLQEQSDPGNPLTVQTGMMKAEMYGKQGDMEKMRDELSVLEENIATYKQTQKLYSTILKDVPFEDDICGIWVSDLAYKNATPYLVVEIQKDSKSPGKYKATILPYCILAGKTEASTAAINKLAGGYNMYTGKPFQYEAKYNTNTNNYFAYSSVDSVDTKTDMAYFYFGDRKFYGTSEGVDNIIIKPFVSAIGKTTSDVAARVASDPNRSFANAQFTSTSIKTAGDLFAFGFAAMETAKTNTVTNLEFNMQRLFAGCADIDLVHNTFTINSATGNEKESTDTMQMRLYKMYPEDKILFAANGNELFGYRTFTKEENLQAEEYKHLQTLKNRDDFNQQAYKKLSEKISDFCFSRATENPDFEELAYECRMGFEYATKGLSYRIFRNKYGAFEGWVNWSGKMNGRGKCTLNDGTTYFGNWDNNKYSGEGKITFRKKDTNVIMQEYTGTFKNNKYHGKGLLLRDGIAYDGEFVNGVFEGTGKLTSENGDKYEGTWKNDKPVSGTITYTNGDRYEGQWTFNQKTQQIERHGQGVMIYANGETASGKWKNNELTAKK